MTKDDLEQDDTPLAQDGNNYDVLGGIWGALILGAAIVLGSLVIGKALKRN